ncbi:MAG: hypothetical protein ACQESF_05840 [Nanobdellota archaeon]
MVIFFLNTQSSGAEDIKKANCYAAHNKNECEKLNEQFGKGSLEECCRDYKVCCEKG